MDSGSSSRLTVLVCASAIAGFGAVTIAGTPLEKPELEVERVGATTRIAVRAEMADGGMRHALLRETAAAVAPRGTGRDPAGRAAFATWDENGERWFALSRDGGASWSRARPLDTKLRLRDGDVVPGAAMPAAPLGLVQPPGGRLFLVQFRTIGLPEWRAALAASGAEVLNYFPHNAHIVRIPPARVASLAGLEFVERIEPYHPGYRLDGRLRAWLEETDPIPTETKRVNVMAFAWGAEGKARIAEAARTLGASIVANPPSGHILELLLSRDQLRSIVAHDDVLWADPWGAPETDMNLVREDAGTNFVEDNFGYCGDGVHGEVMDSGVEDTHMDFDGILTHGSFNSASHGTSTFGIVFGNGDRDGDGQAQGTGHMPCAGAQGIFADYGFVTDRFAHTQELKSAPYFASFQTNSWGDPQTPVYTSKSFELDDIIWRLDIAITQSQSNTGDQDSRPQAWAKNIISVGGIRHKNTLDTADDDWSGGASIGPAEDGRIKPDVSYWYDSIYTTTTNNAYTSSFGGTSAATPETAGVVGLIVQMYADNVWGTDPFGTTVFEKQPHFSTIKALLINNAQQYDFSGQNHDLTRVHQGWGRPSARVAYERAANSFVVDEDVALELSDFSVFDVDVQPGETELKVTLVYPDPPGTTSAAQHRVNDVNLLVTSPSGTVYHGNHGLLDGTESTPGGQADSIDTVENVFVLSPEAGIWKVDIEAVEINQDAHLDTPDDDVAYALVVTGGTSNLVQPADGRVRMNRLAYGCDHTVAIRVIDGNVGAASVTVEIRSDTESQPEVLTLNETRPGSGKYAGQIDTSGLPAVPGDGLLSTSHGDRITVDYFDADDGAGGTNVLRQDVADADCQEPVIGSVGEQNVTDVGASIVWTTDELANSEVVWGDSVPPTQSQPGFGDTTGHLVTLTGLQPCTVYYYEVRSEDPQGNLAVDQSGGRYYHFETKINQGNGLQACNAGELTIGTPEVSCADTVDLRVEDLGLDTDPQTVETVAVAVSSTTETVPETIVLTETGPATAIFVGSIPTGSGPPVADGVLQTAEGDVITATYRDADEGTGSPAVSFDTAVADCAGPAISSLRVETITDQRATVRWSTVDPADTVLEWGPTPALGTVVSSAGLTTSHAATVNRFSICQPYYFRVQGTDALGNTTVLDNGGQPFEFRTFDIPGLYYREDFEGASTGWTLQGEWQFGAPQALGGSSGPSDPAGAYNNDGVLGHDLSGLGTYPGDYEPGTVESAFSPVLVGTTWTDTKLLYHRQLSAGENDAASMWLYTDGVGRPLFTSIGGGHEDDGYQISDLAVGVFADGAATVQIEVRQAADASGQYAGWNVDDIIFKDGTLPDYAACRDCGTPPSFGGLRAASDADACGAGGVTLTWDAAVAWGSGDGGSYAVYRDTTPGFTPSAGNLVAAGIPDLFYDDVAAPQDQTLYYLVRAENDDSCASGPNNGGLLDGNSIYAQVDETTSSPTPAAVGGVLAEFLNYAHVRLTWNAAAGATRYRIYRSPAPDSGFLRVHETTALRWDDLGQGGNGNSFYYRVVGVNDCGIEGP